MEPGCASFGFTGTVLALVSLTNGLKPQGF